MLRFICCVLIVLVSTFKSYAFFYVFDTNSASASSPSFDTFQEWIDYIKHHAVEEGLSQKVVDNAFANVKELHSVVHKENNQLIFFPEYYKNFSSMERLHEGRKMLKRYHYVLKKINQTYRVSPYILIALWNMETHYGKIRGRYPIINVLSTLAFRSKRHQFFEKELIDSLKIIESKKRTRKNFLSGWAGASGQFQFMPSTYLVYAVSYQKKDQKNIWDNIPDSIASAANYLHIIGWNNRDPVVLQVHVPQYLSKLSFANKKKTILMWKKLGVKVYHYVPWNKKASLVLPIGLHGPAFLVFKNYYTLEKWNHSSEYALTAGLLMNYFKYHWIYKNHYHTLPFTTQDIKNLQICLTRLSILHTPINGKLDWSTRKSIAIFQKKIHMIPDGYPTKPLLEILKRQCS